MRKARAWMLDTTGKGYFILQESNAIISFERKDFTNWLICLFYFLPASTYKILPTLRSSVSDTTHKPWQHSVVASICLEDIGKEMCSVSLRMKSVTSKSRCLGLWVLPCQHGVLHRWQVTEVPMRSFTEICEVPGRGLSCPSPRGGWLGILCPWSDPTITVSLGPLSGLLPPEIHQSSRRRCLGPDAMTRVALS